MVLKTAKLKFASSVKWCAISVMCVATASCSSTGTTKPTESPKKRSKEYFAESVYGVKASPRVVEGDVVPKGGGRFLVGNSYTIKGRRYQPREEAGYDKSGLASWYGDAFHGRRTANGEIYDKQHLSAAHPTMPLPSYARVTNLNNGASVLVRVNDRGPFHAGRLIDVSAKTAELLDFKHAGTGKVRVQYVGRAPLDGDDTNYLMASYIPKGGKAPAGGEGLMGTMLASVGLGGKAEPVPPVVPAPSFREPVEVAKNLNVHSAQVALAPQQQSVAQQALSQNFGQSQAIGEYPLLPEYGPFVSYRPDADYLRLPSATYAAAYADLHEKTNKAHAVFNQILANETSLTEGAIIEYAKRQGKTF